MVHAVDQHREGVWSGDLDLLVPDSGSCIVKSLAMGRLPRSCSRRWNELKESPYIKDAPTP